MKPERHCYKAQTGRTYLVKELFPNTQFARCSSREGVMKRAYLPNSGW